LPAIRGSLWGPQPKRCSPRNMSPLPLAARAEQRGKNRRALRFGRISLISAEPPGVVASRSLECHERIAKRPSTSTGPAAVTRSCWWSLASTARATGTLLERESQARRGVSALRAPGGPDTGCNLGGAFGIGPQRTPACRETVVGCATIATWPGP